LAASLRVVRGIQIVLLCLEEARPTVQGVFLLRMLAGISIVGGSFSVAWSSAIVWAGIAAKACAIVAVYIYNGVMDVEEDRANGSARPIARGALLPVQGRRAAMVFGAVGLVVAMGARSPALVANVLVILAVGWCYSAPLFSLKRFPAGFMLTMVLLSLPSYHAGYVMTDNGTGRLSFLVFVTAMLLWLAFVGQSKDLSDVEGDRSVGRRSLPIAWGEDAARWAISVSALLVGGSFGVVSACFVKVLMLPAVLVFVGAVAVAILSLGPWGRGERKQRRRPYAAFMVTQYVGNISVILTQAVW